MTQCLKESLCSLIHKRENCYMGYLRTEGGIIRIIQLILVLIKVYIVAYYYEVDSLFTMMAYNLLLCINALMLVYIVLSCIVIFFILVETRYYKKLHYHNGQMFTVMSIFQLCIIVYSYEKSSSEPYGILIALGTCFISLNIYDLYFGTEIQEEPLIKNDSFLYFNGERSLNYFTDCIYRDAIRALLEEGNISSDSLSTLENSLNNVSVINENDSGIVESDIVEAESKIEKVTYKQNQRAAIKADKLETSKAVCATNVALIPIVNERGNTASMDNVIAPEDSVGSVTIETSESGATVSQTIEPDETASVNKNTEKKRTAEATVAILADEPGNTQSHVQTEASTIVVTAQDKSLAATNIKEKQSRAFININVANKKVYEQGQSSTIDTKEDENGKPSYCCRNF